MNPGKNTERRAVIFDLDGTLLDSIGDIADAMNYALDSRGYPVHETSTYRAQVGDGILNLARRILPETVDEESREDVAEDVVKIALGYYGKHLYKKTKPYPGIHELIRSLRERQIPLAILSNKEHSLTKQSVEHYFDIADFNIVRGALPNVPLKPDPASAIEIAGKLGMACENCYFLGDTGNDIQAALGAGMQAIGVAWGFRDEPELRRVGATKVIQHPSELLEL